MDAASIIQLNYYKFTLFASLLLSIIFGIVGSSFIEHQFQAEFLVGLSWFVCFYWWPLWTTGYLVTWLREEQKSHYVLEFLLLWCCLFVGYVAKEFLQEIIIERSTFTLADSLVISSSWALILYSIARTYEYSKVLILTKIHLDKAKIETLRYQLNPHLLFNSLNTISAMIHTEPDKADRILHDLASLLRFSLALSDKEKITIESEIDLVKRYVSIEKARFGELLSVEINAETSSIDCLLPPLLIQTLVENAIKHNSKNKPLHITITTQYHKNKLTIVVSDTGVGFPNRVLKFEPCGRVGLQNIKNQISNLPESTLSLKNGDEHSGLGAIATILITQ